MTDDTSKAGLGMSVFSELNQANNRNGDLLTEISRLQAENAKLRAELEQALAQSDTEPDPNFDPVEAAEVDAKSIEAANAQSDAEPVAWLLSNRDGEHIGSTKDKMVAEHSRKGGVTVQPLYLAPSRPDASAGPVAWREVLEPFAKAADKLEKCRDDRPLWAALDAGWPQREAIPLTVGDLRRARAALIAQPPLDTSAGPDSKLEELVSRWEALKDGGGPSAPCGVLQDELLTIISLARKGLTAPPHPSASAGLLAAAEIAHSLKGDAYLYTATEAGREGFMMACYKIAETLRVRAVDRNME